MPPNEVKKPSPINRILAAVAVYLIPVGMMLFSIFAALTLDDLYPDVEGTSVALHVLPTSPHTALDPATVYETIAQQPATWQARSGEHAWLLARVAGQAGAGEHVLQIPSRNIVRILCWDARTLTILGGSDQGTAGTAVRMAKLGTTINVGALNEARDILCYSEFAQSARISAQVWSLSDFLLDASRFDHGMGMLEGGLLTPAILILIIGIITRESTYTLLAAWLIANMRLGAFAIGWDAHWFGFLLPADVMPLIRHITVAVYYVLTVALLQRLLRANRYHARPRLLCLTQASALGLLVGAFVLPAAWFWPVTGVIALCGLLSAIVLLSQLWARTALGLWFWHMASIVLAFSILIGLAAFIVMSDAHALDSIHTTVLLLISSAAMVLAMAERLRNARNEQLRLQTELVTSYAITPLGMFTLDAQGRFLRINPVLERMLGFKVAERPEARWTDFFPQLNWAELSAQTQANKDVEVTANTRLKGQQDRHFAIRAIMVDKTIEGSLQDISAHAALIEQLRLMSGKDPVTDSLNQQSISNAIDDALNGLNRNEPSCLARINLRHFKGINDLFGYSTGDAVLMQTRKKISSTLTEPHLLGRIGGDEFAILFQGRHAKDVQAAIEDLAESLNNHLFTVGTHIMNVKVAVGLIDLSHDMENANEVLFTAGRACRDAYTESASVALYETDSPELREHREILHLFDQLEGDRTPDGLRLVVQPILSLHQGRSWGLEVLLRANDSQGKPLQPGRVIAAAEDIGAITTIDKWVFASILQWLDENHPALRQVQFINVNISALSLSSEPFTEHLFRLLDRYKHLNSMLLIEMTEGVALENLERSQQIIQRLQSTGVRIGLDDFGAGYTSLSYLRHLKADLLKIDGTLVKNMLADRANVAIVQSIARLAHHLEMHSVAEWVEDIETLNALRSMGIDYAQGYLLCGAIPLEEALKAKTATDFIADAKVRALVTELLSQPDH